MPKPTWAVIKTEERRRADRLQDQDPDLAYDQWLFYDAPFINELCLVFLVALRHHVERRLVQLAARAIDSGRPIRRVEYASRLTDLQQLHGQHLWKEIERRLGTSQCVHHDAIESLRHLANAYKHNSKKQPDERLLNNLGLDPKLTYAELPESGDLQKGLAVIVALSSDASYCEITERYVNMAKEFLDEIQSRNAISRFRREPVSLVDFAH